jgi:penicillin amidase
MRKGLIIAASVLLAPLIIIPATFFILVQRSYSAVDGAVHLKGLKAEVEIYRDGWGVPHIYAQNEEDLIFAQGYVQAQDRLWQMELHRRMGSGTLSEVFGESTLDMDKFARALGLRKCAGESCPLMDADMQKVLSSYCSGVNEFIRMNNDNLPVEFTILGFKPAEWLPMDTITVANLVAWDLGKNWEVELLRGRLVQKLGAEKAWQLLAAYPDSGPLVIPPELLAMPLGDTVALGLHGNSDSVGSNSWVVDGSKTVSGKPLLANDPHLLVMMPSIWYETGLHGAGFEVAGVSIPGCPLIISGRNANISWGITNLPADTQDLFIERINPAHMLQYEYQSAWKDMQVSTEQIPVAGRVKPEQLQIRRTVHGTLLDGIIKGLEQPLSIKWAGDCHSNLLKSAYKVNKAGNWKEFHEALRFWDAPGQNIVYADKEGNIGYQATGLTPIRAKGNGMVPSPGWNGEYDWTGFIPYDEMPSVLNPSSHFIVTANNRIVSDNYSYFMGYDWTPPFRSQRITDLLKAKEKLSVKDFKDIHADVFDIPASLIAPYITRIPPQAGLEEKAMEILKKWDYYDRADSPAAAIFHVTYVKMLQNTLEYKLGDKLYKDYVRAMGGSGDVHAVFMLGILRDKDNPWFDDTRYAAQGTRDRVIKQSFSEAVTELTGKLGGDPAKWKWGAIHITHFKHVLARIPGLEGIFSLAPVATPGSRYTVNVAAFDYDKPYEVTAIPSWRQIIDWNEPDKSLAMHSTGQSGLLFNPHYGDMVQPWLKVEYHTMLFNEADIKADKKALLTLKPE